MREERGWEGLGAPYLILLVQKGHMSFPLTLHCKRQSRGEGQVWLQQLYPVEGEREPLMVGSEQSPAAALRELTLWWGGRQEAPKRSVLETVL